jgi:hypothetical protein
MLALKNDDVVIVVVAVGGGDGGGDGGGGGGGDIGCSVILWLGLFGHVISTLERRNY